MEVDLNVLAIEHEPFQFHYLNKRWRSPAKKALPMVLDAMQQSTTVASIQSQREMQNHPTFPAIPEVQQSITLASIQIHREMQHAQLLDKSPISDLQDLQNAMFWTPLPTHWFFSNFGLRNQWIMFFCKSFCFAIDRYNIGYFNLLNCTLISYCCYLTSLFLFQVYTPPTYIWQFGLLFIVLTFMWMDHLKSEFTVHSTLNSLHLWWIFLWLIHIS